MQNPSKEKTMKINELFGNLRDASRMQRWLRQFFAKLPLDIGATTLIPKEQNNDAEWFELQFSPEDALKKYGIILPTIPSDDIQLGFTGQPTAGV
jgi:hypothetical protein